MWPSGYCFDADIYVLSHDQVACQLSPQQRVTAIHDFWVHILEKHEGNLWQERKKQDSEGSGNDDAY